MAELNVKADNWIVPMTVKGFLKNDGTLASCELVGPNDHFKLKVHPDRVPFLKDKLDMVVFVSIAVFAPSIIGAEGPGIQLIKGK